MILKNKLYKSIFITFAIALTTLVVSIGINFTSFYKRAHNGIYDSFFRLTRNGETEKTDDIIIVAIDDYSLARFSENIGDNWPWSRNWVGLLANYLAEDGAKAVVFDIIFSGADFSTPGNSFNAFGSDYYFYEQMKKHNNIILACNIENNVAKLFAPENLSPADFDTIENKLEGEELDFIRTMYQLDEQYGIYRLDDRARAKQKEKIVELCKKVGLSYSNIAYSFKTRTLKNADSFKNIPRYKYVYPPYDLFSIEYDNFGFVDVMSGDDGVSRLYKPVVTVGNKYIPSLALAAYLIDEENLPPQLELNKQGDFTLNWYGPGYVEQVDNKPDGEKEENTEDGKEDDEESGRIKSTFNYYSAWWIILNARQKLRKKPTKIPEGTFKDKVIFVGSTARGLLDQKSTPFTVEGNVFPGVELHATAYANLKNKDWIRQFPRIYEFIIYFFIVLLFIYLGIRASSLPQYIIYYLSGLLLVLGVQFLLFINFNTMPQMFLFIFMSLVSFLLTIAMNYITVGHNRNKIRQAFGTYVSPDLLKRVTDSDNPLSTTGENIDATAVFIDIAGFTTFSEKNTPERVVEILNLYLKRFSECIIGKQGYINKYLGDGLMALFGTPTALNNHAELAVQSAFECMKINDELHAEYGLNIRIGVNSGRMIVGNVGGGKKLEYTSIGDSVNLASRLEGVNKFIKAKICVGEKTYEELDGSLPLQYLGKFSVKGKDIPIGVYFYLFADEQLKIKFDEMVKAYENQDQVKFEELVKFFSKPEHTFGPAEFYIQFYEEFKELFGKPIKLTEK